MLIREVIVTYKTPRVRVKISGPGDAAAIIRKLLPDNSREHFIALFLDGSHQIANYAITGIGSANFCQVCPRELFQRACLAGAVSIIVAHNHPSGVLVPSASDSEITKKLESACKLLDIKFLDHLIVNDTNYYSFTEGKENT